MRFSKKYSSIYDLPYFRWEKIHENNDLGFLLKKSKKVGASIELENIWEKISDEFFTEFGFSKNFLKISKLRSKISSKKISYINTSNRIILNIIKVYEHELKELLTENTNLSDFNKNLVYIEKTMHRKIDKKKITVFEYFNYMKNLQDV